MQLRYGCNPHQEFASADPVGPGGPIEICSGAPSMINLLDVLNAWQLVRELRDATGLPAAASFKHVSPAGAAVAQPLTPALEKAYEVEGMDLTPPALAYVRARGADPKCSYGDMIAISDPIDGPTARFIGGIISDGIVAPDYSAEALEILRAKKKGKFVVVRANADFRPEPLESRQVFGVTLTQSRNDREVVLADLDDVVVGELTDAARRDLLIGLVTLKYTQSNSVGFALDGQMIGVGAGQQSRVDCTKLAGQKAAVWFLGQHPKVLGLSFEPEIKKQDRINWRVRYIEGDLTALEAQRFEDALQSPAEPLTDDEKKEWVAKLDGVSFVSDGLLPFRDNIDHAQRYGVRYVAQPGGSIRDDEVVEACREYGISMANTNLRLFHH